MYNYANTITYAGYLADDAGASSSNSLVIVLGSVLVAGITSGFAYLTARASHKDSKHPGDDDEETSPEYTEAAPSGPRPRPHPVSAAKHYTALLLWMAINHPTVDPRKIVSGYETPAEVQRAT